MELRYDDGDEALVLIVGGVADAHVRAAVPPQALGHKAVVVVVIAVPHPDAALIGGAFDPRRGRAAIGGGVLGLLAAAGERTIKPPISATAATAATAPSA